MRRLEQLFVLGELGQLSQVAVRVGLAAEARDHLLLPRGVLLLGHVLLV